MEVSMKKKKKEKIVNVAWQEMPGKNEAGNGDALSKLGCLCKEEKIMARPRVFQTQQTERRV